MKLLPAGGKYHVIARCENGAVNTGSAADESSANCCCSWKFLSNVISGFRRTKILSQRIMSENLCGFSVGKELHRSEKREL
jgi:hypothetical protein